ncbi:MAG: pyridoxal phosphate-dependent decarboxylase family protein, partial [Micromonosporaceae bacterium]
MSRPRRLDPPPPYPALSWDAARAREFADRALDLWEEFLKRLPELPITPRADAATVARAVATSVPDEPMPDDELFGHLRDVLVEWPAVTGHPRFLAYVVGSGTVPGAVADLLASGVNMNLGGWVLSPSATEIELRLMRWFAAQFGLPETAGGLMLSGGAMATFTALKAARDQTAGWDVRGLGVDAGPPLLGYASADVHVVTDRAFDMLGLGTHALRKVATGPDHRMRVDALRDAIETDLAVGARPYVVVATAGTTATGAIDPLPEIADLCAEHGLWLHVDAAYGGAAVLADDLRPALAGIERAGSIAFDPHKWLYIPQSAGCLLVRDVRHLADAFDVHPSFIHEEKELSGRGVDIGSLGPQFSRGFAALKVWVSLLAHGRTAYARRISHDAALARFLGERAAQRPEFQLAAPVSLSTTCFRYVPPDLAGRSGTAVDDYLDLLNQRLMTEVQMDGRVSCSNAVLAGRFVLRACVVNYRTEAADVEALLDVAAELGARLDGGLRPPGLT